MEDGIAINEVEARESTCCLAGMLPAGISLAEAREPAPLETLFAEERASVASSVPKRAIEFATGRLCARKALGQIGVHRFPLLADPHRAPVWPRDVVGSITHTDDFCAAAVGRRSDFSGIGIDAEIGGRVGIELWPTLFAIEEIGWLDQLPEQQRPIMATVLFSAKESFYKAQYSITGAWLDFKSAAVSVEDDRWSLKLVRPQGAPARIPEPIGGRFAIRDRHVFTAIAIQRIPAMNSEG